MIEIEDHSDADAFISRSEISTADTKFFFHYRKFGTDPTLQGKTDRFIQTSRMFMTVSTNLSDN